MDGSKTAAEEQGRTMNEGQPPRVLVADDEDAIRTLVAHLLRRAGFEPVQATDGRHAIERLDAEDFDAVVLDLMMPRIDDSAWSSTSSRRSRR